MQKLTNQNLHIILSERLNDTDFVLILNALIKFLRRGGKKQASERFDLILSTLKQDDALCRQFSLRFYAWLSKVHIYPALIKLGIFSRHSFTREMGIRIYERFSPSYKDFSNLREVFLYLFHSKNDDKWLQTLSLRQWLGMYELLQGKADPALLQMASRQLADARLRAVEMLSIWIASEAIEPDLIRIAPRLLEADSAFVALQREIAKLAVPLMVATFLSNRPLPPNFRDTAIALAIIVFPTLLVAAQPDLGTSILVCAAGIFVLFLAGLSWKLIFAGVVFLAGFIPIMWFFLMHDYQKTRVMTLIDPEKDPLGAGYHIIQSKIAIGSGMLFGKGLFGGTQSQLNFLPENHTDFIFAVSPGLDIHFYGDARAADEEKMLAKLLRLRSGIQSTNRIQIQKGHE